MDETVSSSRRDALDVRWRNFRAAGRATDALIEINASIETLPEVDQPWLRCWQASAFNFLQQPDAAVDAANLAIELATQQQDRKTLAVALFNRALAESAKDQLEGAAADFAEAERMMRRSGQDWSLGAVLAAKAVLEFKRSRPLVGLELLEEASKFGHGTETELIEAAHRKAVIALNRASALFTLGRTDNAIDQLLIARREADETGNSGLRGDVNYNLALIYSRLSLYGSMLDAAENAQLAYSDAHGTVQSYLARVLVVTALVELGQHEEARLRLDSIIRTYRSDISDHAARLLILNDFRSVADTLGFPMEDVEQGVPAAQQSTHDGALFASPPKEVDEISKRLDELIDLYDSSPEAYRESELLLSRLAALPDPRSRLREVVERVVRAPFIVEKGNRAALDREVLPLLHELEPFLGRLSILRLAARVRNAAAARSGSAEDNLSSSLAYLGYLRQLWLEQHDETHRSSLLFAKDHPNALQSALAAAHEVEQPSTVMEIIESFRLDMSNVPSPSLHLGLPSFKELNVDRSGLVIEGRSEAILPRLYSVRGYSATGCATGDRQTPIEIDDIRRRLTDANSAWLSFALVAENLHWALVTPDDVLAGTSYLDHDFWHTFEEHLLMLPVRLPSDIDIIDGPVDLTIVRLISLSRSTGAALMCRRDLQEAALTAIPASMQTDVRDYCDKAAAVDADEVYATISSYLLPAPVREFLGHTDGATLLLSVPPTLATIPFGLLPVRNGVCVLECALVQLAPPAPMVQTDSFDIADVAGIVEHLISITNPTDDLPQVNLLRPAMYNLSGWSEAKGKTEVATKRRIIEIMRCAVESRGAKGLLSFLGHIETGTRERPSSAALVCAAETEGCSPEMLTANELFNLELDFPSRVYLGGCEGTGFGTGLEWASVCTAAIAGGAKHVVAYAWPIINCAAMTKVDRACLEVLTDSAEVGPALKAKMQFWLTDWRAGNKNAISPHFWAGLQYIRS